MLWAGRGRSQAHPVFAGRCANLALLGPKADGMSPFVAKRWKVLIAVGLTVALVDQWTKFLAVKHLTPGIAQALSRSTKPVTRGERDRLLENSTLLEQVGVFYTSVRQPCRTYGSSCPTIRVVDGFWSWRYVENPGAAWGILSSASEDIRVPFFFVLSIAAVVFIIGFFRKLSDNQWLLISSLSLVFGGAIGNFIDRLHLSYVIDFIDWYAGTRHWPTFNFADAAITTGVALLIIESIRDALRARANDQKKPQQATTSTGS